MGKDSAARIELGRSFHQMGTVNEKVCESDFEYILAHLFPPCILTVHGLHNNEKATWTTVALQTPPQFSDHSYPGPSFGWCNWCGRTGPRAVRGLCSERTGGNNPATTRETIANGPRGGPLPTSHRAPRQLDGPAHTQYAQISHTRSSGGAAPWPRDFPARKTSWRAEEQRTDLWLHEDRQDKLYFLFLSCEHSVKTLSEHDLKPTKQPQL